MTLANGMVIRTARVDDFQAIAGLITSQEELFRVYPAGQYPFTVEQVRKLAEQRMELTVLTEDGVVVGFANLYVAFNFSLDIWVDFKTYGMLGLTLLFVILQAIYLAKHMPEDNQTKDNTEKNTEIKTAELKEEVK